MLMPSTTLAAKASYKKLPGTLELTPTHLQWTQDGKKAPSIKVPHSDAASLFCSKEGAAQVRLKLGLVSDEAGHNFTFLAPQAVAVVERERFKTELTNIISVNRRGVNASGSVPPPVTPISAPSPGNVASPRPPLLSRPSTSRAASVASESRTPGTPTSDPAGDFQLRIRVLLSNPDLAALHRELVMSRQITEDEFWEGRQHILQAQRAQESQRRGKPGQLVDPRPQSVDGEIKIVITPQLKLDIFDEYPVVKKAFEENVDKNMTEPAFWHRYFQSKLFNSHRASIRSAATQHVVKDDPIFDKYLEKEDDELEPRRLREDRVDIFIDLGATLEDHVETGNERDITMQAGKQRAVLPLIRKFNEHSGRLLDSVLGDTPNKRRRIEGSVEERYAQLDLEDLHDNQSSSGITLANLDSQRYFEGRSNQTSDSTITISAKAAVQEAKASLQGWSTNLSQLKVDRKAGGAALEEMTQNVAARLEVKMRKEDIPEHLYRQMAATQTATNEFLRQFWLAIYPPPADFPTAGAPNAAQKAAKAAKMVGYLERTHEKVEGLRQGAHSLGVDPNKIYTAMKPVLDAAEKAMAFWRQRNAAKPPPPR